MILRATRRYLLILVVILGTGLPSARTAAQETPAAPDSWPTTGWSTAAPEAQGMDPALLAQIEPRVEAEFPLLSGLLVVRGGDIVYEKYFNGQTADTPVHLWSVTKSVTSIAVGLAIKDGLLRLDQTLGELIPELIPAGADPRTASVTVEDLLTMTSGWEWDSRTDVLHLDDADDWAVRTIELPLACDPGTCYEYNSGNAHLASVIVQKVTGEPMADYLQTRLFDPLGIARPTWRQSPQGETAGGFGLELTPRDAAKLGFLFLNQGTWDGEHIVPAEWVAAATSVHSSGTSPSGVNLGQAGYGYFWWATESAGFPAYFALGFGTQVIYVVPALDLVAVAVVAEPNVGLQQDPVALIQEYVIPAALAGPSGGVLAEPAAVQQTASPQAVPAATPVAGGQLFALPGDHTFPLGIAYDADSGDFYTGSIIVGTIYRGNVATGEVEVFLPGRPDLVATGLALDSRGHLYVAGGQTGCVAVYDLVSRERTVDLCNGLAPNTFVADVALTADGDAFFTDSFNPILYRLPAAALPAGQASAAAGATPVGTPVAFNGDSLEFFLDLSTVPNVPFGLGYNATGIEPTPDGTSLLVVQGNTGLLFLIDLATGGVSPVDLGDGVLTGGRGMKLDGQTLYVVTGNEISVVDLASDFRSGRISERFSEATFASPTAIERYDGCLLVVNSQVDQFERRPELPFTISSVAIPAMPGGTPAPAAQC
jgi:CubicO group peptidase (beta-lactamase class C family)